MKNKPEISIVMATFNRADLIEESLNSILNQSFLDWECLIIDDGSTDNTKEVVRSYLTKDFRFKYFERLAKYNKGLPGSRNYGIDLSKGDYIVFFDDDDIVHPFLLELCIKELKTHKADFCRYLRTTFRGEFNNEFNLDTKYEIKKFDIGNIGAMITHKIPFNSCQILWKKSSFKDEKFNEHLMYAEEWEFYSRLLADGLKGITLEKVLFYGRKHAESNTGEYQKHVPVRRDSHITAYLLVIENLGSKKLLSPELQKFFIRMGFYFKSKAILNMTLLYSTYSKFQKGTYRFGFYIYPLLKPIFYLKSKILAD